MGLVVRRRVEDVPGLVVHSWHDNAALRLRAGQDMRPRRTRWVRAIVLHTTKGIPGGRDLRPQVIRPGLGPNTRAVEKTARYWSGSDRKSGAHLVVDHDGSVACLADLATEAAYHAGPVNDVSIGIELYQGAGAELYEGQLAATVKLVDYLTKRFGIQRQVPRVYRGGPIARLEAGGRDVVGVYGHRDVTRNRGRGDPGDAVFDALRAAGYEAFDLASGEDRAVWSERQAWINAQHGAQLENDGVPGLGTVAALTRSGHQHGLWMRRTGDVLSARGTVP